MAFHAYGVACRHFAGGPDPATPLTYPEVYAAGDRPKPPFAPGAGSSDPHTSGIVHSWNSSFLQALPLCRVLCWVHLTRRIEVNRNAGSYAPSSTCRSCAPLINRERAVAGAFAGLVQCAVSTPVDLLKIRQQLQRVRPGERGYVGPLPLLRNTWRAEGLAGVRICCPL